MAALEPAFCGLLPHPPIIVPDVGKDRLADCRGTTDACSDFARRFVAAAPDRLFLVSPHSPRLRGAFGLWSGERLAGDLGKFGAPDANVDLPNDREVAEGLERTAAAQGVKTWPIPEQSLDHGSIIPLWFLQQAGWAGPTCIASLPWHDGGDLQAFGHAVAAALEPLGGRSALVASGDMTHRALPGAPAGYDPKALEFDRQLTQLIREGRLDEVPDIDPEVRQVAAEDAADSSIIVASAIGFQPHGAKVLSYEHPFGVGYLVAVFHDGQADA